MQTILIPLKRSVKTPSGSCDAVARVTIELLADVTDPGDAGQQLIDAGELSLLDTREALTKILKGDF